MSSTNLFGPLLNTLTQLLQLVPWRRSVFNVNFEHISHLVLAFLLLTLNMYVDWVVNYFREKLHLRCLTGF